MAIFQDNGAANLGELFRKANAQSGWTGSGQDFINAIRKQLEDPAIQTKASMHHISEDAVVFNSAEKKSVVLIHESDIINLQTLINESKLFNASGAFHSAFPENQLLNIVTCNRSMFERSSQMASYISKLFIAQTEAVKGFNLQSFGSRYSIDIDIDMSNVRQFFDAHSPSPVVCGTFGFIASLVDKNSNNTYTAPIPMFGTTGYVEFNRNANTGVFTPIVHITDILSVLSTSRILAIALPLIAEIVISRNLWRQSFTAFGDSSINIGNLIVDANQKPYEVKSEGDFRSMFREWIGMPLLCIDVKSGGTDIPGIQRLIKPETHQSLVNEIFEFFGDQQAPQVPMIAQNFFREIVGMINTNKGKFSNLMDTRDLTYLYAVSVLKYHPRLEQFLGRNETDPIRRFEAIREIAGDVTPTHLSVTSFLHGEFLKMIVQRLAASNVKINMPMSGDIPAIDMNEFVSKAYQPGVTMFGNSGLTNFNAAGWYNFK